MQFCRPPLLHPEAEAVREPLAAGRPELCCVPRLPRARGLLPVGRRPPGREEIQVICVQSGKYFVDY